MVVPCNAHQNVDDDHFHHRSEIVYRSYGCHPAECHRILDRIGSRVAGHPLRATVEYGDPDWRCRLPSSGVSRGPLAIDWFFFSRGLFTDLPPFSIGRARFDNWLVRRAQSRGAAVIDGTTVIDALHQRHNYGHLVGGRREAYRGADARRNQALAGWWCYLYLHSILDADWTRTAHGLRPQPRGFRFLSQLRLRLSGLWAETVSADPSRPPLDRS